MTAISAPHIESLKLRSGLLLEAARQMIIEELFSRKPSEWSRTLESVQGVLILSFWLPNLSVYGFTVSTLEEVWSLTGIAFRWFIEIFQRLRENLTQVSYETYLVMYVVSLLTQQGVLIRQ